MKYSFKSCRLLLKEFPYYLLLQIYNILSNIAMSLIPIYTMRWIIAMFNEGSIIVEEEIMIITVLLIFFGYAVLVFISFLISLVDQYIERNFVVRLSTMFYKKLSVIDYDFHESPLFLNDYNRTLEEGVHNIYLSASRTFSLITVICQSISVFIVIMTMHYLTIIFALVLGICYFLIRIRMSKLSYRYSTSQRPYRRHAWYSNRAFSLKDGMADLKTTDIESILLENHNKAYDSIIKVFDNYGARRSIWTFFSEILMGAMYPAILGLLAWLTMDNINIGDFASLSVAATTLSVLIKRLATILGELQEANVECRVPYEVLAKKGNIEGVINSDVEGDFESLEIQGLTFSYDNKKNVLEDINIKIKKGQKIAIVGFNGAGKTTLVKLMLRLYDPNSGDIFINNQNYKDITVSNLRIKVGAVFQNVEIYAVSIAENILLRSPKTKEDYILVDNALKFCGLYDFVYQLERGINTPITREFDSTGIVFSGGQIQRIAIARGYAQNYQLFILDEPSSALDPIAEAKVYQNMLELGRDKTIVFISHRLTTTINADIIYLFENGKIVERGTHQELMDLNKIYRRMFISQSNKYIGDSYEQ